VRRRIAVIARDRDEIAVIEGPDLGDLGDLGGPGDPGGLGDYAP